jgi:hypothetical protein
MDPITIAMGLSQFAPSIIKWVSGSDKAGEAAQKVVDIATQITGKPADQAVEALRGDPALVLEFRKSVMANETQLDAMYLADVADARKRDMALAAVGQRNYRADTMYALAVLVVFLLVYFVLKSELDEYSKGIITLVLGRFLGYLDGMYNFEFGTTRNSKSKDATIENLSK